MRRYLVLSVLGSVLGACVLVLASGPPALATGGFTLYKGKNSQGYKLEFGVDQTARGPVFEPISIEQTDRCPVGGQLVGSSIAFFGFRIPMKNGNFSLVQNDPYMRLDWNGTVTSTGASGKEEIDLAGFDKQGGLQDCSDGSLPWKAQAVTPGSSAPPAAGATYNIRITKAPDGSVHYSITH